MSFHFIIIIILQFAPPFPPMHTLPSTRENGEAGMRKLGACARPALGSILRGARASP